MDYADIIKARRGLPRNALLDALFGTLAPGVTTHDRTLEGPHGDIPVRIHSPARQDPAHPVVLHLHGGGWVLGNLDAGTWYCSQLAMQLATNVVSVDYRMAPEHPFPIPVGDSWAAARWLHDNRSAFNSRREGIVVTGDSAGGNLAAVVARRARDTGDVTVTHQVLVYPATDLTMSLPSIEEFADAPILTRAGMLAFRGHYVGPDQDLRDPDLSPLHIEHLAGLAPTMVVVAELDPLRDDGLVYAARMAEAGVAVRCSDYLHVPHGFINAPGMFPQAWQVVAEAVAFVTDRAGFRGGTATA